MNQQGLNRRKALSERNSICEKYNKKRKIRRENSSGLCKRIKKNVGTIKSFFIKKQTSISHL